MDESERHRTGFEDRTRLPAALEHLDETVSPIDRTRTIPRSSAVGRVLAATVTACRPVPHYERVAADGYAVVAGDTSGAKQRSPVTLELADSAGPGRAVPVDSGDALPGGADAVVGAASATRRDGVNHASPAGESENRIERVELSDAVRAGENVDSVGSVVAGDATVFEAGRRLRQTDPGFLGSVGVPRVEVYDRPTVGVVPTGDAVVDADPGPGEVVESSGLTVAGFTERWGGTPTYRDVVAHDRQPLRVAVERDLTKDVMVTTGGTSVGDGDLSEVVADLGDVRCRGLAIDPGASAGIGVVRETPVLMLPGEPIACLVAAVQLLEPAVKRAGRLPPEPRPATDARLDRKIASEDGVRTFARVRIDRSDETAVATPTQPGGARQSSATTADGWVGVPEDREEVSAGETVSVEHWQSLP